MGSSEKRGAGPDHSDGREAGNADAGAEDAVCVHSLCFYFLSESGSKCIAG